MCGIAGFIKLGRADFDRSAVIKSMTDSLAHRGPDDSGFALLSYDGDAGKGSVTFGHRRLSIIDLSEKAHQPMEDKGGDLVITYNGEIYNYLELKNDLMKKGYAFISSSDTEVVLKAYEEWGTGCFARFNGMWAFALWDERQKLLFCSRDRFGVKPFYYVIRKGDSLGKIAREKLKDDSQASIRKLYNANKDKLRDPDNLPVGVKLEIPA